MKEERLNLASLKAALEKGEELKEGKKDPLNTLLKLIMLEQEIQKM